MGRPPQRARTAGTANHRDQELCAVSFARPLASAYRGPPRSNQGGQEKGLFYRYPASAPARRARYTGWIVPRSSAPRVHRAWNSESTLGGLGVHQIEEGIDQRTKKTSLSVNADAQTIDPGAVEEVEVICLPFPSQEQEQEKASAPVPKETVFVNENQVKLLFKLQRKLGYRADDEQARVFDGLEHADRKRILDKLLAEEQLAAAQGKVPAPPKAESPSRVSPPRGEENGEGAAYFVGPVDATNEPVGDLNMGQLQPGRASRRGRNLGEGLIRTARAHRRYRMGFERSRVSRQLSAFETAATGADAIATGVAAVEIASGFYGRDLSLAEVSPRNARTAAISPGWLALAGRSLARDGSFRCDIEVRGGRVALVPASSAYAVQGTSDPATWIWILTLFGPGDTRTRYRSDDAILNVTIGSSVARPWEGRAPWQAASLSGKLLSGIEKQLAGESQSKSGYVLPVPDLGDRGQGEGDDGESDPLTTLRRDLASAEGRTMLAPSMASGFGAGPGTAPAPASEYVPRRFGANPPTALTELRRDIERSVLASYGILPSLIDPKSSGTALRESRRQFHGTIHSVPLRQSVRGSAMAGLCGPFYFFSFVHNTVVAVCLRLDSIQDVNKADPSANTKPNQPTTWLIRCRPSFLSFSTLGGGGIGERFWTQELDANGASFASCLHGPTSNASLGEAEVITSIS